MAGLERRLDEAAAALATLDEAIDRAVRSLIERDGAILRLIYTFEAVWKACQQQLAEREGIEVASRNSTIRAARRLGWLSDEDAAAVIGIGRDRNLAVDMYRGEIGAEIAGAWARMPWCCAAGSRPCRPRSLRIRKGPLDRMLVARGLNF